MDVGNIAKWVDELAGVIENVKKRVAAVAADLKDAKATIPEISVSITEPANGQTLLYDSEAEAFVNADVPATGDSNTFSTTETVIGTWIDGRPIYRTVIDKSETPIGGTTTTIDITDLNVDILIRADALGTDNNTGYSGTKWNIGSVSGNSSRLLYINNIDLKVEGNYYKYYFIVEYVKPAPEPVQDTKKASTKKK